MENQEQEKKVENVISADEQLGVCQKQCEEYLNGWKRTKADFINYKKEEGERLAEIAKYTRQSFIFQILPMLDNLDITVKELPQELLDNAHVKGLLQVKTQLEYFLKSNGVEAIEVVGQQFDPNFHEVIQAVESPDQESGIIIEEIKKGYKVDGNLLRPAKVKVTK